MADQSYITCRLQTKDLLSDHHTAEDRILKSSSPFFSFLTPGALDVAVLPRMKSFPLFHSSSRLPGAESATEYMQTKKSQPRATESSLIRQHSATGICHIHYLLEETCHICQKGLFCVSFLAFSVKSGVEVLHAIMRNLTGYINSIACVAFLTSFVSSGQDSVRIMLIGEK